MINTEPAGASAEPRRLTVKEIRALGTLYEVWAESAEKRITLAEEFDGTAETLITLNLISKSHTPPYRPTYQITEAGRRRYEEINPKKAAESREYCSERASGDCVLKILCDLGYDAQADSEGFTIKQGGTAHILSRREISGLLACPLKHPQPLSKHLQRGAGMSWYSFPQR